jgi:hypothetical protein
MSIKISEAVSRLKKQIKAVSQDAFLTDRFVFSVIKKHAYLYVRRQDSNNKIMKVISLFQSVQAELEEVDPAISGCRCISTGCRIKRTKGKLPEIIEGHWGPIIRSVSSLDYSVQLEQTYPTSYEKIITQKNFKYNNKKYFWFLDGYLYFPDLEFDFVKIEALFEVSVNSDMCDPDPCEYFQDKNFYIPDFLFAEIEQGVLKDLMMVIQIPQDLQNDQRHITR